MEGQKIFMKAGGERFTLIPCLNTSNAWLDALAEILTGIYPAPDEIKKEVLSNA
jgi:protoheme ferro-lyase